MSFQEVIFHLLRIWSEEAFSPWNPHCLRRLIHHSLIIIYVQGRELRGFGMI